MAYALIKYATPNESALHSKKNFYSNIKHINESVEEWFHHIEESISGCEFGALSDVMLIDKFVSGLDSHLFGELAKATTLTVEQILSIVANDGLSYSSFTSIKTEPEPNIEDFLSLDLIKNENLQANELIFVNDFNANSSNEIGESIKKEFDKKISGKHKNKNKIKKVIVEEKDRKNNESNIGAPADELFHVERKLKGSILNDKKQTVCLDCGKVFVQKHSYTLHSRLHSGKNLHVCKICSKPCVTRTKLRTHMSSHEHDGRSFECYLCSSKLKRFFALRAHMKLNRSTLKKGELTCTYCDRRFTNPKRFELHLNVHKGITDPHQCPQCDKIFYTRPRLMVHLKLHSDFREFQCETCGNGFKTKIDLKLHNLSHTGERPFKCAVCGKMFRTRFIHKNHMRQHTGERTFKCDLCDKTFVSGSNLRKHMMRHNKVQPHACTVCPKRFTASSDLKLHMCVHTGEKPYQCTMCLWPRYIQILIKYKENKLVRYKFM